MSPPASNNNSSSILRKHKQGNKAKKRQHISITENKNETKLFYPLDEDDDAIIPKKKKKYDSDDDDDDDMIYDSFASSGEMISIQQDRKSAKKLSHQNKQVRKEPQHSKDQFQGEENNNEESAKTFSLEHETDNTCPIEPFNLNDERNSGEGYFDGDMYVFRKSALEEEDDDENPKRKTDKEDDDEDEAWLEDSKTFQSFAEKIVTKKKEKEESKNQSSSTLLQLYTDLIDFLEHDNETTEMALQRLSKKAPDKDFDRIRKRDISSVTDIANAILMRPDSLGSDADIYTRPKRFLLEYIRLNSNKNSKEQVEEKKDYQWFYRGNQDQQIHGPFTTKQMMEWKFYYGYFVGDNIVDVYYIMKDEKKVEDTKSNADELMKDLLEDDDEEEEEKLSEDRSKDIVWMKSDQVNFELYL